MFKVDFTENNIIETKHTKHFHYFRENYNLKQNRLTSEFYSS